MIRRLLAWTVAAFVLATSLAAQERRRPQAGTLKVGDEAPAFALADAATGKTVKLADLRGKPVVLVFGSCT